uniref:tRNA-specific 2-thiouridylase MnmA n=1 Tax=candidate division CPR3 bacterium TaxID=2268181 RepID=A0A7V3N4J9_UNCC3
MKKRVVVAMSGGVDSSVCAALLKNQGFDVVGVFMKLWAPGETTANNQQPTANIENRCCNIESLEGARRVAAKLGIPFYTIDLVEEFRKYVVNYYIKEYSSCHTPNPCVICNKFIKFKFLLEKALALEAEYLATGHYVRLRRTGPMGQISLMRLFQAKDKTKDQSYFLWTLTQEQLKHLLFPIGDYTKTQVREMAKKWGLPTAERAESQGLCFIGYWDNREFLGRFIEPKPGPILDLKGNILGKHCGLPFYTIGQRRGLPELKIKNYAFKKKGETPPLYVVKLDPKNNALIVGEERDLYKKELEVKNVSWINETNGTNLTNETGGANGINETNGIKLAARIRYGHPAIPCKMSKLKTKDPKLKVTFQKPVRAITPGQSIVFYKGEEVLGGGVIR